MNSKTLVYILKRIGLAIITVWVVITVTFFVMHAVPGGPFAGEKAVSPAAQAALEAKYGLDKPLMEQYGTYLKDAVTKFDFGPSLKLRGRQVVDVISDGLRVSVKLGLVAAAFALAFGIVLGAVAALMRKDVQSYSPDLTAIGYDTNVVNGTWAETYDVLISDIKSCTDNEVR